MRLLSLVSALRATRRRRSRRAVRSRCVVEVLENRHLLAAVPWGATAPDTAEYMLGSVLVTVVFMESNGGIDGNTENWTASQIAATKQKIQNGVEWWEETLASITPVHSLDFEFDFTYADTPVPTQYEPISRTSDNHTLWVNQFLDFVGFNSPKTISEDIRAFNHAQRLAHDTNWAYTVFIANAANDSDGQWASGSSFAHAFAFAGGRYVVAPSTRPETTFAHETGHMFWARDEYIGGASWNEVRGYYDTQNLNAADNPTPDFVQQDSIMANGTWLVNAYNNHTSADSTLAHVGWQDTDNNGIFDVLDVPHTLQGSGRYDPVSGRYRFSGDASVNTLPNLNSSGLQNDITVNRISRAEYRIDGGTWTTAATYDNFSAVLNLSFPVPSGPHQVEIRTVSIDPGTQQVVASSPIFLGNTLEPSESSAQGIHGSVWNDVDADGEWDPREIGLSNRNVQLVDANGQPLSLQTTLDPDAFDDETVLNNTFSGYTLSTLGFLALNDRVTSSASATASTGDQAFGYFVQGGSTNTDWRKDSHELQVVLSTPQTYVRIDAIGVGTTSYGRLEAYDANGDLLERFNTGPLSAGQVDTMSLSRPVAEIASIKAFGRSNTSIELDNLRIGHPSRTMSNDNGAYWLEDLGAGSYLVQSVADAGTNFTAPAGGRFTITLGSGDEWSGRNFGVEPQFAWQNPNNAADVNNDRVVTPLDASLILAEIARSGIRQLPPPTDTNSPTPFWDAKGDNVLSPFDALLILRRLVSPTGDGETSVRRASNGTVSSGTENAQIRAADNQDSGEGEPSFTTNFTAARKVATALPLVGGAPLFQRREQDRHLDQLFASWGSFSSGSVASADPLDLDPTLEHRRGAPTASSSKQEFTPRPSVSRRSAGTTERQLRYSYRHAGLEPLSQDELRPDVSENVQPASDRSLPSNEDGPPVMGSPENLGKPAQSVELS